MTISIENEYREKLDLPYEEIIDRVVNAEGR